MSSKNFCNNLGSELSAWKDSVNDIVEKFEARPGHAKAGVLENIEDIHILIQDLEDRIKLLKETCSLEGFDDVKTQRQIDIQSKPNVRDIDPSLAAIGGGYLGG